MSRALGLLLALAATAHAASPILVTGDGTPWRWTAMPIHYRTDQGTLGSASNATVVAAIDAAFAAWAGVSTAMVSGTNDGMLPVDVTGANAASYISECNDGITHVLFDEDGAIMDAVLGAGAHLHYDGYGTSCAVYATGEVTHGMAIIEAGAVTDGMLDAVARHEIGHVLGLAHTQTNALEAVTADPADDTVVPVMDPTGTNVQLQLDDRAGISTLYPAPGFTAAAGSITGHVFLPDGHTPFHGAVVIARKTDDPRVTAVGCPSGARYWPGSYGGGPPAADLEGLYEIPGLPAGQYTVEIEGRRPEVGFGYVFDGTPLGLPGPPEFWNGAHESADVHTDVPWETTPVTVNAGATVDHVDFVIDDRPAPDDCAQARAVDATPAVDVVDTTGATTAARDPVLSCATGPAPWATHTVWYRFTAPAAGRAGGFMLGAEPGWTSGGTNQVGYVALHAGTCDAPVERACGGNVVGQQPQAVADVQAGETILIEFTGTGGTLRTGVEFAACGTTDGGPCPTTTTTTTPATTTTTTLAPCAGLAPLPAAGCAIDRARTAPLCEGGAVDPKLARAVQAALRSAAALVQKAGGANRAKRVSAALARADKVLAGVRRKAARTATKHELAPECQTAIDGTIDALRSSLAHARAGS